MIERMIDLGLRARTRIGLAALGVLGRASGFVHDRLVGVDRAVTADLGRARGLSEAVAINCPRCHASPGCPCLTAGGQPSMRVHSERMQSWKEQQARAALTSSDQQ